MKPTSHTTSRTRVCRGTVHFPITDVAYQALTLDGYRGSCANKRLRSFRNISNDYFKNEARQSFVTEVIFFVLMVLTASWPVLQSIRAMTDLVRAYSGS
jgi:hypothetical protein